MAGLVAAKANSSFCGVDVVCDSKGLFTLSRDNLLCPGTTDCPPGQLCLVAGSDSCNCSHEFFVALGQLQEAGYPFLYRVAEVPFSM